MFCFRCLREPLCIGSVYFSGQCLMVRGTCNAAFLGTFTSSQNQKILDKIGEYSLQEIQSPFRTTVLYNYQYFHNACI